MSGGFEDLGLLPELVAAVTDMGWLLPSDVQDEAIPLMLGGGDVMVAAETGSGKTGAFGLPMVQLVHEIRQRVAAGGSGAGAGSGSGAGAGSGSGAGAGSGSGGGAGAKVPPASTPTPSSPPKLNLDDRTDITAVANDGLVCQTRDARRWGGVRASHGLTGGKHYFEVVMRDEGLCRVGWSALGASLDLGTDEHGYGFGGTGKKSNKRSFDSYGEPFGHGDVIGCLLDASLHTLSFTKNGKDLGVAFRLSPAVVKAGLFPTFCMKNAELAVNFGDSPFAHTPPTGYTGVAAAAASSIKLAPPPAPTASTPAPSAAKLRNAPLGLVIEPARELALQTSDVLTSLTQHVKDPPVRVVLLMGGIDTRKAAAKIQAGCDIVVATPGVLAEFVKKGKLDVSCLRLFVLDEADRMTDPENLKVVNDVFKRIPKGDVGGESRLQVCFFSATLHSPEIGSLSDALCQHPTWVDLKGKDSIPDTVYHVVVPVDPSADRSWSSLTGSPTDGVHRSDRIASGVSPAELSEGGKRLKLQYLLSVIDSLDIDQAIIFCRTNVDCDNLEKFLTAAGGGKSFRGRVESGKENKYSCCVMAGFRRMEERLRNLDAFREGDVRFLIATDVAARGIDIRELPCVINLTLPDVVEHYIHRVGRVGRAGKVGLAISLASTAKERVWYHKCNNRGRGCSNVAGCTIWYDEPSLLKATEKRLSQSLDVMAATPSTSADTGYTFTLPPGFAVALGGGEQVDDATTKDHVAVIASRVKKLSAMETQAQLTFYDLKARFAGGGP